MCSKTSHKMHEPSPPMGGYTNEQAATEEIQQLCSQVHDKLEEKAGRKFTTFKAIKYISQVVAGINYIVKIQVGEADYIHAKVFKPLPQTNKMPEVTDLQDHKTLSDKVLPF